MNYKEELKKRLKKYSRNSIVFTQHALVRAEQRNINLNEIIDNIVNPKRLIFAKKQKAENPGEEKYNCYFLYSNTLCHRYVMYCNK